MASKSLNRVILIGNLTRDPELKYTPNGTAVTTFGVATNRSWATATGEIKEDVQFHRIVCWQKLAELAGKLLSKGRKIYLEGRIVYRTYTGKDGVQRTTAEIVMDDFILFDDRSRQNNIDSSSTSAYRPTKQVATAPVNIDTDFTSDLADINLAEDLTATKESEEKSSKKSTVKKEEVDKPEESQQDEIGESDIPF